MPRRSKNPPPVKYETYAGQPGAVRHLQPIADVANRGPGPAQTAEQLLDLLAGTIRGLRKRAADDIIEIGFRLTEAKALAGHGNWLPWLEREFGWSEQTARNYMQVHEMAKSQNFGDLDLPVSSLYLLASPSTPPEAVNNVLNRAKAGEKMTGDKVKGAVADAKRKKTKQPVAPSKEEAQQDYETKLDEVFEEIAQADQPETPPCLQGLPDDDDARKAECMWRWERSSSAAERALLWDEAEAAYERAHPGEIEAEEAEEAASEEYREKIDFVVDKLDHIVENDSRSLGEVLFDLYHGG